MTVALWFLVYVLAVYRLAEIIANDKIFYGVRRRIGIRAAAGTRFWKIVADWMHCPLCVGVWFAFPAAVLYEIFILKTSISWQTLVIWLGISGAQYFLSCFTSKEDSN